MFTAKWAMFQLYLGENKIHSMKGWWCLLCTRPAHWNNSPWVDMSLHLDTLFWFRANKSLLLLLNVVCLVDTQQIHNCKVFGLTRPRLEPMINRIRGEHANYYTTDAGMDNNTDLSIRVSKQTFLKRWSKERKGIYILLKSTQASRLS